MSSCLGLDLLCGLGVLHDGSVDDVGKPPFKGSYCFAFGVFPGHAAFDEPLGVS